MKIAQDVQIESPFFGNYICLIPNTNFSFVAVAKNASSFLKKVSIYNKTGEWFINPENEMEPHNIIGFSPDESEYLFPVDSNLKNDENLPIKKFAVWRDPVERMESLYQLFCIEREFRGYFWQLGLYENSSFEHFYKFVQFEYTKFNNPLYVDEHIRRQADYYKSSDIDDVVHIKDLEKYLKQNEIGYVSEKSNKTQGSYKIKDEGIISEIKQIYAPDYDIKITF